MTIGQCLAFASILVLTGCGSTSSGSTTSPTATAPTSAGPATLTLTGSTRQTSVSGCSGDSHNITMSEGAVSITLLETTDPANALSVQVCSGTIDTGACSIKQQRINVGQTLSGARVGMAGQVVKLLPFACVFGSTFDPTPVTYKVSLTYQQ